MLSLALKASLAVAFCAGMALAAIAPASAAPDAYYVEGTKLYAKGDLKRAAAMFQMSLKYNPTNADVLYYSAVTHQRLGDLKRAKFYYENVVRVAPSTQPAIMATDALKVLM